MDTATSELVNLSGLARRLRRFGLSKQWLKAEAEAGRLPCMRIGRRLLFSIGAVEAALIRRAAEGVSQ
ncbi:MAG: hypothetical protein ACYC26_12675 [Phycisphaerales bacterium]